MMIPAITIWQPWATLIAEGYKPFEFRGWPAPKAYVGRRIAIHAGARKVHKAEVADLIQRVSASVHNGRGNTTGLKIAEHGKAILRLLERVHTAPGILPLSSVLCIATLGDPVTNAALREALNVPINDSDRHDESNWGWPLTDIKRLEPPQPARGAQGFWHWVYVP